MVLTLIGVLAAAALAQGPVTGAKPVPVPPAAPSAPPAAQAPAATRRPPNIDVRVTDGAGEPAGEVHVSADGPARRVGDTTKDGMLTFRGVAPGTYRFRFERDGLVTLEKEVVVRAGANATVEATLSKAPPAPVVEAPPPPLPAPVPAPVKTLQPGRPRVLSVPDTWDREKVRGRDKSKETALGCSGATAARMIEFKDDLPAHVHEEADEVLYVVAGEGSLKLGSSEQALAPGDLAVVPRGMEHTLVHKGRTPSLLLLSVISDQLCP
jgi:mannose-6-phosphate isomerase-like protein (cupin superfamily)